MSVRESMFISASHACTGLQADMNTNGTHDGTRSPRPPSCPGEGTTSTTSNEQLQRRDGRTCGSRGGPRETEPKMRTESRSRCWALEPLGAMRWRLDGESQTAWGGGALQAEWPVERCQTRVFLATRSRGHAASARRCAPRRAHRALALPLTSLRSEGKPHSAQ